jgi:hypothetical protein
MDRLAFQIETSVFARETAPIALLPLKIAHNQRAFRENPFHLETKSPEEFTTSLLKYSL